MLRHGRHSHCVECDTDTHSHTDSYPETLSHSYFHSSSHSDT